MTPDVTPEELKRIFDAYTRFNLRVLTWLREGDGLNDEWKGPRHRRWNDPSMVYRLEDFDYRTMNLGTFTGWEIESGKFLIDYDLDWTKGLYLAKRLLPKTGFGLGRQGKSLSHLLCSTTEQFDSIAFKGITRPDRAETTYLEIRNGNFTHQTMLAPSLHSPGIRVQLLECDYIQHLEAQIARAHG